MLVKFNILEMTIAIAHKIHCALLSSVCTLLPLGNFHIAILNSKYYQSPKQLRCILLLIEEMEDSWRLFLLVHERFTDFFDHGY